MSGIDRGSVAGVSEPEATHAVLLAELAAAIRREPGAFLSGYLVLPDDRHFPDRFTPTRAGLTQLLRRLHHYLGIPQVEPRVTLELADEELVNATDVELVSVDRSTARYLVRYVDQVDVVFALAEEVALAALLSRPPDGIGPFRDPASAGDGKLRPARTPEEAVAATLLAVARGLGVLVAAGAHQYRAAGSIDGRMVRTAWRHVQRGALEPGDAAFLVAVQLVVRAEVDRDAVLSALPRDRADEARRALGELKRDEVIAALELPPVAEWPARASYPVPALEAPTIADEPLVSPRERRKARARTNKAPIYRVRTTRSLAGALLGTLGGGALAMSILASDGGGGLVVVSVMLVTATLGTWLGRTSWTDACSDSDCEVIIPPDAERCPGCRRPIAGVVGSRKEALQAGWASEKKPRRPAK